MSMIGAHDFQIVQPTVKYKNNERQSHIKHESVGEEI